MPFRDLFVLSVVAVSMPLSLRYPFYGLCVFTAFAYVRPQDIAWEIADLRLSLPIALCMLIGMFLQRERIVPKGSLPTLMVLVWVQVTISVIFAIDPQMSWDNYDQFSRMLLIAVASSTMMLKHKQRIFILAGTIMAALAFHGGKGGLFSLVRGLESINHGPGGLIEDRNDYALALAMGVPLVFAFSLMLKKGWQRYGLQVTAGFMAIAIVLTHSRGGALSLATAMAVYALSGKRKLGKIVAMALVGVAAISIAPETFFDRMSTIETYEEDASAMGRIEAWGVAIWLGMRRPLVGVGFDNFMRAWADEVPGPHDEIRVAHNTYLQFFVETGFPGLLLFLALLLWAIWTATRIIRRTPDDNLRHLAVGLRAALITFIVGAMFLNRAYFDMHYQLYAVIAAADFYSRMEEAKLAQQARAARRRERHPRAARRARRNA